MDPRHLRKTTRVRPAATAPVRVDIMGDGFLEVLRARDISVGGLGISVDHNFVGYAIESQVELIVTLGRHRPFKTQGQIRHRSCAGMEHVFGIQFVSLEPKQREAIKAYVEQHSPDDEAPISSAVPSTIQFLRSFLSAR